MKRSSDYRADARANLSGKWGKAVLISLGYFVVFFVLEIIEGLMSGVLKSIFSIAVAIIEVPLGFGFILSLYRLFNGEDAKAFDFLQSGFSNFKKSWLIGLNVVLKMIIPIIMVIVGIVLIGSGLISTNFSAISGSSTAGSTFLSLIGTILYLVGIIWAVLQSYYYQLAYVIAIDNEELSSKEVVVKCKEIMYGKRWKLFCLQLSFIGWYILAAFSFGIGLLWLIPYIQFAMISFCEDAIGKNFENVETE